jgi:hypothetical protein
MYGRWGYFAEIKANIRWWFMAVLNDPTHVRYRTYVAMQHDSVYILPRRFLQGDRVETSLARCLHWNEGRHEEWRPRHNLALLQIVADYYDIEFLEFSLPMYYTPPGPPGPPTQMHFPRVRGTAGRPQVCIYMEYNIHSAALWQPLGPPAPVPFPTTAVLSQRVETMPWYVPGVQGYTPASMPVTLGPGTGQNDPFMVAPKIEEYLVLGRRNHPDLMPILPTPAVVAGWNNQLPGPGANLRLGWEDWMAADGSPINQDRKAVKGPDGRTLIGILHLRRKRPKKVVRDRSYRGRR